MIAKKKTRTNEQKENGQKFAIPIVVTTVVEKKRAWPKVQFGSLVALRSADMPCALAFSTCAIKSSSSSSANRKKREEKNSFNK